MDPFGPPIDEPADPMGRGVRGEGGGPAVPRPADRQKRNRLGERKRKDRRRQGRNPKRGEVRGPGSRIGVVPQARSAVDTLTVKENILLPAKLYGKNRLKKKQGTG